MIEITSIAELPNIPAIYAICGGKGQRRYVAYLGQAGSLKKRIAQHLVARDSSVATGTSAVVLNPDYVTQILWWTHPDFSTKKAREAAEIIAAEVCKPALSSRGAASRQAGFLSTDKRFSKRMRKLFKGPPSGRLRILTLQDALDKIAELEKKVAKLDATLQGRA